MLLRAVFAGFDDGDTYVELRGFVTYIWYSLKVDVNA